MRQLARFGVRGDLHDQDPNRPGFFLFVRQPTHLSCLRMATYITSANMSQSAFIGQPPNNENDYWAIKGMYRAAYSFDKDPSKGYLFVPKKPDDYVYNDRQAGIIAGMIVAIAIMFLTTSLRLALRQFKAGVRWGIDDWVLIPGVVCEDLISILPRPIPQLLIFECRSWPCYILHCR